MSQDNEKIKDKIRKLLNLANNEAAFEGEARNAMSFARRLMIQHNIPEDSLGNPQDRYTTVNDTIYAECNAYTFGRDMTKWESTLMHAIDLLIGTTSHYRTRDKVKKMNAHGKVEHGPRGEDRTVSRLVFYGPVEDARDAVEIFNEWVHIIVTVSKMKYGSYVRGGARSYCEGFAWGLYTNMKQMREEEKAAENVYKGGSALVVFNAINLMEEKRKGAVVWLAKEKHIKIRTGKSHRNRGDSREDFDRGATDGKKADFSREQKAKIAN